MKQLAITISFALAFLFIFATTGGWVQILAAVFYELFVILAGVEYYKLKFPRRRTMLDRSAVDFALEWLNIELPVEFHFEPVHGIDSYYMMDGFVHHIYVNNELSYWQQSLAVWHELSHAMQCERDFDGDGEAYHAEAWDQAIQFGLGNELSPIEAEAQKIEYKALDIPMVYSVLTYE